MNLKLLSSRALFTALAGIMVLALGAIWGEVGLAKAYPKVPRYAPVLVYHHVTPERRSQDLMTIPVTELRKQLGFLKSLGYSTVFARDIEGWLKGGADVPPRTVVLTFDDGYESFYRYVFPLLKEMNMKATVFVVASTVGTENKVTWEELREMEKSGLVEIGGHSFQGHGKRSDQAIGHWDRERALEDTRKMVEAFQRAGIRRPDSYAFPFGVVGDGLKEALELCEIKVSYGTVQGLAQRGEGTFNVKRVLVMPGCTPVKLLLKMSPVRYRSSR